MLIPDPKFVRTLLSRYAELQMRAAQAPDKLVRPRAPAGPRRQPDTPSEQT
ncbi:DUF5133 domain-containing protein [Streptomyces sp. YC504]|uniref:DUF5133 domain-containing protein n=1 Tax=Streptomyces mesophilus TaxID=1775132 RepID=A0A6G4XB53_9ACTN|nr:DUF5133 domain-containing protein [Streptomyces mesophilus]NGO74618.1 DUF5133 domain-containing protein [Streptomyces mesophilus]